uniref:Uncharacterized protein n=1 Tax=Knipowitschia caucasica TaxID=637954 RepID=A0AAV2MTH3_KNICA
MFDNLSWSQPPLQPPPPDFPSKPLPASSPGPLPPDLPTDNSSSKETLFPICLQMILWNGAEIHQVCGCQGLWVRGQGQGLRVRVSVWVRVCGSGSGDQGCGIQESVGSGNTPDHQGLRPNTLHHCITKTDQRPSIRDQHQRQQQRPAPETSTRDPSTRDQHRDQHQEPQLQRPCGFYLEDGGGDDGGGGGAGGRRAARIAQNSLKDPDPQTLYPTDPDPWTLDPTDPLEPTDPDPQTLTPQTLTPTGPCPYRP